MQKFWIIWSPQGHTPPKCQHDDQEAANTEARRLARLHPGQQFFIMGSEALAIRRDVDFVTVDGRVNSMLPSDQWNHF